MAITIRSILPEDAPALAQLFSELTAAACDPKAIEKEIKVMIQSPDYALPAAFEEEKLVGAVKGIVCRDIWGLCKPFLLCEDVVIASGYRGMGIGKRLLGFMEHFARECGCKEIILISQAGMPVSHRFYEAMGFATEERLAFRKGLEE